MRPDRAALLAALPFEPDRFQIEAFDALDLGRHVVVAAPTGSGKTAVAEYAIAAALADGRRAFYTAPIKALSNQKFHDLVEAHGEDPVGLLTGDTSVNGDADVVVMTTEVLRNMVYAGRDLSALATVVIDEVHFLQDTYRGPVWEEVIIHLPPHVRLVCLSATVSNVGELAEWIETVRGATAAIVERRRPVALENRYLVADRTHDRMHLLPTFVSGGPNRDALRLDQARTRRGDRGRRGERRGRERNTAAAGQRKLATPSRVEVVELLDDHRLLPAIHFIFSRAQCDEAAASCLDAGLRLTSPAEQDAIRDIVDDRLHGIAAADLDALGVDRFVEQLMAGVAAHHAGMVPAMKEVVEACFVAGLVKVVFATETLAVGINMPARSVVIEKLTKFTGDHHEQLTPGEYTQLTGRAGRRGLDEVGDAIVLWSPWVRFDDVAQLASSSSYHLRSAFRPTYNMTANLVRTHGRDDAHRLLSLCFAQFQADRDVVKLEARLDRKRQQHAELLEQAASDHGDVFEYRRLQRGDAERRQQQRTASDGQMRGAMARLRPGAVIRVAKGKHKGPMAVVSTAHRKAGVKLSLVTRGGDLVQVTGDDFDDPPVVVGQVRMPRQFTPGQRRDRDEIARRLRTTDVDADRPSARSRARAQRDRALAQHPVLADPRLREKVDAAGRAERVAREIADIEHRVARKHQSLSAEFDRVLAVLADRGFVDLDAWGLTDAGSILARVFHESDLLVAETIRAGLLDDLAPADLAAVVSCLVYEHRSPDPPPAPWFSGRHVRDRWERLAALSEDLQREERRRELAVHRPPDPTFAAIAHAWVAGEGFASIVGDEDLTGGDFVRTTKQLVDLLRQVASISPVEATRDAAHRAIDAASRGVVADSSVVA
ncbi:MAG: DEAD/DEAH box helicase [Actinomycetota bacterium]